MRRLSFRNRGPMTDSVQKAIALYEGSVVTDGPGVRVTDPRVLSSERTGPTGPDGRFRVGPGEGGGALAALGTGSGDRGSPGLDPRSLPRPGQGGVPRGLHGPGHEHPDAGLRHRPGGLPGGPGPGGRGHHPRDRPLRDRLHRPAPGRVRRRHDRRRAAGGVPFPSSSRATTARSTPRSTRPTRRPRSGRSRS